MTDSRAAKPVCIHVDNHKIMVAVGAYTIERTGIRNYW